MRLIVLSLLGMTCVAGQAVAQAQPPIQSAQDAACRADAQSRLFSTPNPQGLSLYDLGAQLYRQCMDRQAPARARAR